MWSPTHTQVTVQRARGLPQKGTNHVFVVIVLSKEKYQTSVKEKGSDTVEWHEKCELKIPKQGNTAVLVLTALSSNFLGVDQFLGCVNIPLSDLDVYERPRDRWYDLQGKQSKGKVKDRGQLEVRIGFSVKQVGLNEVNKKESQRASLGQLSHQMAQNVGGSLASLGSVDKKTFKKLAKSITKKIRKDKKLQEEPSGEDNKNLTGLNASKQAIGDADPGVISDDDEFAFDDLSHTGSGCSLEVAQINNTSASSSIETVNSTNIPPTPIKNNISSITKTQRSVTPIQEKYVQKWEQKLQEAKRTKSLLNKSCERIVVGGETTKNVVISNRFSPGILQQFSDKSREELIELILQLQNTVNSLNKERKEMEDYIDNLLVRVIEKAPEVLQNPYAKK